MSRTISAPLKGCRRRHVCRGKELARDGEIDQAPRQRKHDSDQALQQQTEPRFAASTKAQKRG